MAYDELDKYKQDHEEQEQEQEVTESVEEGSEEEQESSEDLAEETGEEQESSLEPEADLEVDPEVTEAKPKHKKGGFVKKLEKANAVIAEKDAEIARLSAIVAEAQELQRPSSEAYEDYETYEEHLADYKLEQRMAARDAKRLEKLQNEAFNLRVAEYAEGTDLIARTITVNPALSEAMKPILFGSQYAGQMVEYLTDNPDISARIAKMPEKQAIYEMAKLEGKIEARAKKEQKETKEVKPISKAPAPLSKTRGTAGPSSPGTTGNNRYKIY